MTVILGTHGRVQLRRTAEGNGFISLVKISDVNIDRNRFSFDYLYTLGGGLDVDGTDTEGLNSEMSYVPLITGDRVRFLRVDKTVNADNNTVYTASTSNQELVDIPLPNGTNAPASNDFVAYVNVDGMGSIRLFQKFEDAINFNASNALQLKTITANHYLKIFAGQSDNYRGLAMCKSWEFTTTREQVDVTSLGKNFRRFYSNGLIEGQGKLNCLWPIKDCELEPDVGECENARYLAELILRLQEGAEFSGHFILRNYIQSSSDNSISLYYKCDKCIITSVGVNCELSSALETTIEFVTTGPFDLRINALPSSLLLDTTTRDDDQKLLQEIDDDILLFRSEND